MQINIRTTNPHHVNWSFIVFSLSPADTLDGDYTRDTRFRIFLQDNIATFQHVEGNYWVPKPTRLKMEV